MHQGNLDGINVSDHLRERGETVASAGLRAGHQRGLAAACAACAGDGNCAIPVVSQWLSLGQRQRIRQPPGGQATGETAH